MASVVSHCACADQLTHDPSGPDAAHVQVRSSAVATADVFAPSRDEIGRCTAPARWCSASEAGSCIGRAAGRAPRHPRSEAWPRAGGQRSTSLALLPARRRRRRSRRYSPSVAPCTAPGPDRKAPPSSTSSTPSSTRLVIGIRRAGAQQSPCVRRNRSRRQEREEQQRALAVHRPHGVGRDVPGVCARPQQDPIERGIAIESSQSRAQPRLEPVEDDQLERRVEAECGVLRKHWRECARRSRRAPRPGGVSRSPAMR